jgi:hypothetical protein
MCQGGKCMGRVRVAPRVKRNKEANMNEWRICKFHDEIAFHLRSKQG